MPFLELSVGGRVFPLRGGEVVGRHRKCDVRLLDAEVSRKHARIVRLSSGDLAIEDAGSANGVRLNGKRLKGLARLSEGDLLEIGALTLRFVEHPSTGAFEAAVGGVTGWDEDDWDDELTEVQRAPRRRRRRRELPELPEGTETEEQVFAGKKYRASALLGNAPVGLFSPDSPEALLHNQRAYFPAGLLGEAAKRRA